MSLLLASVGVWTTIWSILVAVLVLLVMVTIHELGHYIAGKILGFKINEFSIGFGPALFKKEKKNGEVFALRLIPLGGYCAFEGEDSESNSEKSFEKQKPWKRIVVLLAGAFMNFITTLFVVILVFVCSGQYMLSVNSVLPNATDEVVDYSEGLRQGDIIKTINGKEVYLSTDFSDELATVKNSGATEVYIIVIRDGENVGVNVPLRNYALTDANGVVTASYGLGITQGSTTYNFGFFEGIGRAFVYCFKMVGAIFKFLGQLLTGLVGLSTLSGPISTIGMTAEIATYGFRQLMEIVALLGVNLAVFNLLPIPALDGSKVVFTVIEWIRKKPVNKKVENAIHVGGFLFLLIFAVLVDLLKLF